nr:flagellar biosynthetic protein FliO [uncultured Oscillibacter sp.]
MLGENPIFSLLGMILSVVVIIGLAYWFTRYVAGRGGLGAFGPLKAGGGLEVLAQLPLGRDQKVIVVQAGQRYFLLGVTASEVSLLAEFTAEETACWLEQAKTADQKETPSFRQALDTVLRQKGRR